MGKVTIRTMSPLARMLAMAAAIFLLLCTTLHDSSAQTQPSSTAQPQKIEDLLKLLGDPEVQKWAATQKAGAPVLKPAATGQAFEPSFDAITERIRRHISDLAMTVPGFPAEIERATSAIGGELTGRGPLWMILLLATFLGAGFFMQWAVWRLSLTWRQWIAAARLGTGRERLIATAARLVFDAAHGLAFAIGSMAAFLLFDWPPFTSGIIVGYLLAAVMFWLARAVLEFLLSPSDARRSSDAERFRIIPMADGAATFWARRLAYAAGWFTFGWITVSLLAMLGFSLPSQQLIAYTLGIVLVAIAIEGIWRNPEKAESTAPSADRRLGRKTKNWLWSIYFAALWISWVVGAMRFFWFEVVAVGLPGAVLLTEKAVNNILRPSGMEQDGTQVPSVLAAVIERGIRVFLILAAILLLAWAWGIDLLSIAAQDNFATRAVRGGLTAMVVLLLADFVWHIAKTIIDRKLAEASDPGEHGTEEARRRARVRTLLPIVRNVLVITVAVVALLMALSSLGVQIAPLIAGAGVVGVAIGFGAQTVVKDIISGFFYLLDDAFRVGEYIESGSFKGTVESFSLRSVKLRHHRGALYTIPFSELGTVQNQSRDWVIEKITVTVTYDSDVEKARKIVKKIGLELAEDPEFKKSTLEPLKMQGIDNFGDSGIVLRMKLKTRPGEQFGIKRNALMMIKKAFEENDINMAYPTVQIAGAADAAAAAAAQHALAMQKADETRAA